MRKHPSAFTLIELLVVIAIIGVLVSMLIPVLGKARALAVRVSCASNQRQAGIGINVYLTDFADWLPLMTWNSTAYDYRPFPGVDDTQKYYEEVIPYKIRHCPTYDPASLGTISNYSWGYALPFQSNSYAAVNFMSDRSDDKDNRKYVHLRPGMSREYYYPATWYTYGYDPTNDIFPLVTDYLQDSNNNYTISPHSNVTRNGYVDSSNIVRSDGANSLWKDGHVEWHDWPASTTLAWNSGGQVYFQYPFQLVLGPAPFSDGTHNGWTNPGNYFFRSYFWIKGDNGQ